MAAKAKPVGQRGLQHLGSRAHRRVAATQGHTARHGSLPQRASGASGGRAARIKQRHRIARAAKCIGHQTQRVFGLVLRQHVRDVAWHPVGQALPVPTQRPAAHLQPTPPTTVHGIGHTQRQVEVGRGTGQVPMSGQSQGGHVVGVDPLDEMRRAPALGSAGQPDIAHAPGGIGGTHQDGERWRRMAPEWPW